ncbi:MAG: pseudouridine synthase [Hadesarchaea archaeon]|nr:MAG: pseudouridine synthase [Hadesarchaea archaeon]
MGGEYGNLDDPTPKDVMRLRATADYLFGKNAGKSLFPEGIRVVKSRGRIRQVWLPSGPVCAIRASDGFIILNRKGAELLYSAMAPPHMRVAIMDDVAPFAAQGKTVFAKHVTAADPEIRPGEEVFVVDSNDRLLASGRALLAGVEMVEFNTGKAVEVRRGFGRCFQDA